MCDVAEAYRGKDSPGKASPEDPAAVRPAPVSDLPVALQEPMREGQDQGELATRDRPGDALRRRSHHHPGRGAIADIDPVEPDPEARNEPQPAQALERHGYRTPAQVRADQLGAPAAAA